MPIVWRIKYLCNRSSLPLFLNFNWSSRATQRYDSEDLFLSDMTALRIWTHATGRYCTAIPHPREDSQVQFRAPLLPCTGKARRSQSRSSIPSTRTSLVAPCARPTVQRGRRTRTQRTARTWAVAKYRAPLLHRPSPPGIEIPFALLIYEVARIL